MTIKDTSNTFFPLMSPMEVDPVLVPSKIPNPTQVLSGFSFGPGPASDFLFSSYSSLEHYGFSEPIYSLLPGTGSAEKDSIPQSSSRPSPLKNTSPKSQKHHFLKLDTSLQAPFAGCSSSSTFARMDVQKSVPTLFQGPSRARDSDPLCDLLRMDTFPEDSSSSTSSRLSLQIPQAPSQARDPGTPYTPFPQDSFPEDFMRSNSSQRPFEIPQAPNQARDPGTPYTPFPQDSFSEEFIRSNSSQRPLEIPQPPSQARDPGTPYTAFPMDTFEEDSSSSSSSSLSLQGSFSSFLQASSQDNRESDSADD